MQNFNTAVLFKISGFILSQIKFSDNLEEIFLKVRQRRKTANCPSCSKRTRHIHDYQNERKILHRILGNQKVFLLFKSRRFKCWNCDLVFTEKISFLERRKRQSNYLLSDLLFDLRGSCFKNIKEKVGAGYYSLRNYLLKAVSPFIANWSEEETASEGFSLGIDEHHFKNKRYVTTITNLTTHKVKTILPNDRKLTVIKFLTQMPEIVKSKIKDVCCNMDAGFIHAAKEALPGIKVVIDPFHVIQDANRRLNEFRKIEQDGRHIKINWKVFLKAKEHLNEKKHEQKLLNFYLVKYPYLNMFYTSKEELRSVYAEKTKEKAEKRLTNLITRLKCSDVIDLNQWAKTLTRFKTEILNHWDNETTNAYTEGVHVKMKMIQRVSFGFRNIDVYVRKAMLVCLPLSVVLNHSY